MNPIASLGLAIRAMLRNKVRTALTMLGIVIGIASVIAMVALGQGASMMIQDQINSVGRNLVMVLPGAATSGGFSFGAGTTTTLTPDDGAALLKEIPAVRAVAPIVRTRAQIVYGSLNWVPNEMVGTTPGLIEVREWALEEGAFFTDQDVASAVKVCVIGRTVADRLMPGESPVGNVLRIKNMPFKVVGVLERKGTNAMGSDQDDTVIAPWTTVKRVLQGSAFNNVNQLLVSMASPAAIEPATRDITALLRQRHRLAEREESDFRLLPMTEMAATATQTANVMTVLLAVIASISLVVGGIGIMNIMLVSVVERTREIGIRMAVGARGRDILAQFLFEAVVLSTLAGLIGMAVGGAAASIISSTLKWPTLLSPQAVVVALVFSCGVGVFFGLYPAIRASRLDPIEALRYE